MTVRQYARAEGCVSWRGVPCAYCHERPSFSRDHVIPKSLRRKAICRWVQKTGACPCKVTHRAIDPLLLGLVPSCLICNVNKGTRRLVPVSWADRIEALNDFFGGAPWRVWMGSPTEPAYREVHT